MLALNTVSVIVTTVVCMEDYTCNNMSLTSSCAYLSTYFILDHTPRARLSNRITCNKSQRLCSCGARLEPCLADTRTPQIQSGSAAARCRAVLAFTSRQKAFGFAVPCSRARWQLGQCMQGQGVSGSSCRRLQSQRWPPQTHQTNLCCGIMS
jgi:hypothetical protein